MSNRLDQEFHIIQRVGEGSFGEVFKVQHKLDQQHYAVKIIKRLFVGPRAKFVVSAPPPLFSFCCCCRVLAYLVLACVSLPMDRQDMLKECHSMSILNNPHIIRYYGCWEQEGRLHIQMELCENNLSNIAKSRRIQNSEFSEQELRDILSQMSLALMHMHSVPICHMDIKPENIYLHDGFYKLGDLGQVSSFLPLPVVCCIESISLTFMPAPSLLPQSLYYLKGDESYDIKDGDGRYLCKEVLEFDYAHLQQADIFALGASIYELVSVWQIRSRAFFVFCCRASLVLSHTSLSSNDGCRPLGQTCLRQEPSSTE